MRLTPHGRHLVDVLRGIDRVVRLDALTDGVGDWEQIPLFK